MRELRLHPDNVHIVFSAFFDSEGRLGQSSCFGRLVFNPKPTQGLPLAPRYDVQNVTLLFDPEDIAPISVDGNELFLNPQDITVGELRGFTGRGHEVLHIGSPIEAGNTDVFSVQLRTGKVKRLTSHPEYVEPFDISADDEWAVILDTRVGSRHMFLASMQGIPPVTNIVSSFVTTGVRNNGPRRFFQACLLQKYGDRGDYYDQQINGAGTGTPGSYDINDTE
ncbi:hypothetical protein ACHAQA_009862 [Verticillium albo-atrum]